MLAKLYNFLFVSCSHKWEILDRVVVTREGPVIGEKIILQCKVCGTVRVKKTY